jgi:hypothetical protein
VSGAFDLTRLGLEPGDSLVPRAGAGRPPGGLGEAASDTFFIEVAGPGQVALPGFELPPDRERYALSQQMIVLKLQRLRAREATLSKEALTQEVDTIAAEQRAVRANFIFLMGGHVEDEGRGRRRSRTDRRTPRETARARSTLRSGSGQAERARRHRYGHRVPPAKSAVDALQRAFGVKSVFPETLAVCSKLDLSHRLTGDLKKPPAEALAGPATEDATAREARRPLASLVLLPAIRTPAAAGDIGGRAEAALAWIPAPRTGSARPRRRQVADGARGGPQPGRDQAGRARRGQTVSKRRAVRAGDAAADTGLSGRMGRRGATPVTVVSMMRWLAVAIAGGSNRSGAASDLHRAASIAVRTSNGPVTADGGSDVSGESRTLRAALAALPGAGQNTLTEPRATIVVGPAAVRPDPESGPVSFVTPAPEAGPRVAIPTVTSPRPVPPWPAVVSTG